MRHIRKTQIPSFFTNNTSNLSSWSQYRSADKRNLKDHILNKEQNHLCIYCETKIDINTSHLEHIKPKSLSPSTLTFDYKNISVSCNGDCHNRLGDEKSYHCGHRKDKNDTLFDETMFLNPIEIVDLRTYFEYEYIKNEWVIVPSDKNYDQATYMINTLRLNDNGLPLARKKALHAFIKVMKTIEDKETRMNKIKEVLINDDKPHTSFLRFKYLK